MSRVAILLALGPVAATGPVPPAPAHPTRPAPARPAQASLAVPDVRGLARALADSLRARPLHACAVAAADRGDMFTPADPGDPLPAALARALAVPLARGRDVPGCARAGAPDSSAGWLLLTGVRRVSPDRGEALVGVGIRYEGRPDVPRSGQAEDWTYRVVRARGRWRVVGMVGRRRST